MARQSFSERTWRSDPWFRALCAAFASCATPGEFADFLRDIGTLTELRALSERWEVARQIDAGRTYRDITDTTGASTTTITRVARFVQDGEGGYRRILSRQHHHHALPPAGRGWRR